MNIKSSICLLLFFYSMYSSGEKIAECGEPKGTAYFSKKGRFYDDSGWRDDETTGGSARLIKLSEKEYDLIFVDYRGKSFSAKDSGAVIIKTRQSADEASFIIIYPGSTTEIYTFIKDDSGNNEYMQLTSRGIKDWGLYKNSLMRGTCKFINFDKI